MYTSKTTRSFLAAAVFATLPLVAAPAFASDLIDDAGTAKVATNADGGTYWTAERMRAAQPLEAPQYDAKKLGKFMMLHETGKLNQPASKTAKSFKPTTKPVPELPGLRVPLNRQVNLVNGDTPPVKANARSSNGYPFTTERVNPLVVPQWPYRMAGKLFFRNANSGRNSWCSASIISRRLVLTAGHCLYDRNTKRWHSNHVFVPAYDATKSIQPYGLWNRHYGIVPGQWANSSGFPTGNDFGVMTVYDKWAGGSVRKIGEYLGWFGWHTYRLIGNHVKALGYPGNLDFGGRMQQTDAQVFYRTSYAGEIGTSQAGGSSGGPWVQDFGIRPVGQQLIGSTGSNRVVGVTSYGPTNFNPHQYAGASVLNNNFVRIRNKACNHRAGNC